MNFFMVDYITKKIEKINCNLDIEVNLDRRLFYKLIDTIYDSRINVFQLHLFIKESVYKRFD